MNTNTTSPETVAANPELFGLEIVTDDVKRDGTKYEGVHLFRVRDVAIFRENFGDEIIRKALDGTSLRVTFQRIVRDFVAENRDNLKNADEQILRQAKYLCGERNKGERLPYVAIDGTRHATLAEAKAASLASLQS